MIHRRMGSDMEMDSIQDFSALRLKKFHEKHKKHGLLMIDSILPGGTQADQLYDWYAGQADRLPVKCCQIFT